MPVEVTKLEDEPIVIATLTGQVTTADLIAIYEQTLAFIDEETPYLYRISDVRDATSNFPEMSKINTEARERMGAVSDSRIRKLVIVGSNRWSEMYREAVQRWSYSQIEIPVLDTIAEALDYLRQLDD